jgi:hypothetical protein
MIMVLAPHKNAADLKKAAAKGDAPGPDAPPSRSSRHPAAEHRRAPARPDQHHPLTSHATDGDGTPWPKQKTHSGAKKRFKVTGQRQAAARARRQAPPARAQVPAR